MSIDQRPNGKWRARYRGIDGRERSKHFDRKVDAQTYEALQKAALARGDWFDPSAGKITVGTLRKSGCRPKTSHPKRSPATKAS